MLRFLRSSQIFATHPDCSHRSDKKRTVVAVAHTIMIVAYHLLKHRQSYQDLEGNYFDE